MAELYADSTDEEIDAELAAMEMRRSAGMLPAQPSTPVPPVAPEAPPVATEAAPDYTDTRGATALLSYQNDKEERRLEAFTQRHLNTPPAVKSTMKREAIIALVNSEAQRQGVDPALANAVAQNESGFNPHALSPAGAKGVMQLMDGTVKRYKVGNPWNPEENVPGGIAYLKFLADRYPGRPELQAAAYHAGENAVDKYTRSSQELAQKQQALIKLAAAEGIELRVTSGQRSAQEQEALYAQGRTTPGAIVTNAPAGTSRHETGQAFDVAIFTKGKPDWESPQWDRVGALGKSVGLTWGGDFSTIKDRPHFELSGGAQPSKATKEYVQKVLHTMSGASPANPAQISASKGPSPAGRPFVDQIPAPGVPQAKPAQIAAATGPRVPGAPWVDVGITEAPGAILGNARSVVSGAFRAIGSIAQVPGTLGEILGPMVPEGVKDVAKAASLGGIPLGTLTDIWQQMGTAAESVAVAAEVPAAHKTFANKFFEAAGTMAAYWGPAIATGGGSIILPTALEAASEAQEVYKTLKGLVGPDEAAERAAVTLAANVLVLGVTNKLGIGGQAKTLLGKALGAAVGESAQEIVQYETQRRQFWVPDTHPGAQRLKQAHGWQEANGRVYQPFDPKTVGEIAAISAILGGGVGGLQAMTFGLQPPAAVAEQTARIQTQDTQDVAALIPQSVVRAGYGGPPTLPTLPTTPETPSTPELALPGSAVQEEPGELVRVYATAQTGESLAAFRAEEGISSDMPTGGLAFTESPDSTSEEGAVPARNPVYLDIHRPFHAPAAFEAEMPAQAQALGYDGIFHVDAQGARTWMAFTPEQVIPAFEIDAMFELSRQEVMQAPDETTSSAAPSEPSRQVQTLNRWRGYLQAEGQRGGVPLPEGMGTVQPATVRLAEINALIADAVALGETPSPILVRARVAVAAQVDAEADAARTQPPPLPPSTAQRPPPLPGEASPLAASLAAETEAQRSLHLRDAAGRWRIPLKRIPSTELELQDFVAQKGGIQLESEADVPGELRALVSQKETGSYRLQNNRSGQTLQAMAELAAEHGFIATGDKTALLEALDRSVRQGQDVYSEQATGQVPGITDIQSAETQGAPPRPLRPGPPMLPGTQQRAVYVLSDAQMRMHDRATSLSNFLVDDRVEFRLPNGHLRTGRVVKTDGTDVTIQYGTRGTQLTVDVLSPEMRTVRLTLTKAQLAAEAAGIVDLPRILNDQMADLLTKPEREITGRVRGINFDRLSTDNTVKQFIEDAMATSSAFVEDNRRGVINHTALLAMAQDNIAKKRFTIDTLMQRQPGELFSPENVLAARLIGVSVAEELRARIQTYTDNPTPETQAAFYSFYPLAIEITSQWSGLAAETARAMHAFQINATGHVEYVKSVEGRVTTTPLNVSSAEFTAHLAGLTTREQMLAAITKVPTWGDLFLSGLYGVKLMMPTSDARNILGSGALYLWQTGVKQVAGMTSREVPAGEATAHFFGWWHANMMMFRLWRDLSSVPFRERFSAFAQEVTNRIGFDDIAARLQTEGLSGEQNITGANVRARGAMSGAQGGIRGAIGQAAGQLLAGGPRRSALVDHVGAMLHFSGAKMNFEDLIAKVYNYVGEGWSQGYREAMKAETPLQGEALWNWISDYAMDMKGTVKDKAKAAAFENTLTEQLGPASAHLEAFLNAAPLARLAILFFRTPLNAARVTLRNGPLGFLAQQNQEAIHAGGADAALARTRIALGSTLVAMQVVAGMAGLVTGKHPGNRDARKLLQEDAHIPDYSVWVPGLNRYVSYDYLGPITSMLGIGADLGAILRSGAFRDKDLAESVKVAFGAAVTTLGNNVLSQAWMAGANDIFNMWFPAQSSSMEGRGNPTQTYLTRQLQGLVPGPLGYVRKLVDPTVRETYTFLESIEDKIPFLSKNLPVSHNWLGYARRNKDTIGPDFLSPVQGPAYEARPVFRELQRLMSEGYLTMPDRPRKLQVGTERIDLTAQEISDLELRIAGGDPDKTGKPGVLEQRLDAIIRSDMYQQRLSDTGRAEELEKRLRSQMSDARDRFVRELPRLREEVQRERVIQRQRRIQEPDGTVGTVDRPTLN